MRLIERVRRWQERLVDRTRAASSAHELRELFRSRYHAFRLLLAANNKALGLMAEMEQAAGGDHVFGMQFVQSRCTTIGVSVYQMVRQLDVLAPGKYTALQQRLDDIRSRIQETLLVLQPSSAAPPVVPLEEVGRALADQVGAKMASLGEVRNAVGLRVPDGFVVTASAYRELLAHGQLQAEIDRLIQASTVDRTDQLFALSSRIEQLIVSATIPPALSHAIDDGLARLRRVTGGEPLLALRSSALGEDTAEASFAGQYRSQLNVSRQHLLDAYREVVASKYTPQAMHYRLQRGLRDEEVAMCVGCLLMIDAAAGGVAYTGNPNDACDDDVYISATWGLPSAVVDGRFAVDLYRVRRSPLTVVSETVAAKRVRLVPHPVEGVTREEVPPELVDLPALQHEQLIELARQALTLEEHFGAPQDIEWALDGRGALIVLQTRPLRRIEAAAPAVTEAGPGEVIASGGVAASRGTACGPLHWVRRDGDALACPDGAVLALAQPLPRWAALLGRAVAVVAEDGGIAGHLATVAREFGVPALLGMGPAIRDLSDGLTVTVDADRCRVYVGRVEELLHRQPARRSMMAGSPVHRTLLQALDLIAPLNLLDADALSFKPESCRTLHDITRFCHEQAVREMFSFGREQRFPRHASKQLHHHVPMQWWVLDLEDGFTEEITGRYVRLPQIASGPMLAVWRGMVAVPWQGPPAAGGRGMASVLFEATVNPALATPFKRPYATRNYFMISRHFMNLQSRFGFHFSAVESLAGPRPEENYIAFSFKGGAADLGRRTARIQLIADLLDEVGFQVTMIEDTATARVSGLSAKEIEHRLRVIGYLLMHTRQLDVAMGDPASVEYYRGKIRRDIAGLARAPADATDERDTAGA